MKVNAHTAFIRSGSPAGPSENYTPSVHHSVSLNPGHIPYRPDIDGLRALAVLGTVLFHAFPALLPGGFTGVDVFFVISGFLITRILLADLQQDRYSIASFYARRIRRIFPALAVVMITTFGIGWVCLFNDEYKNLGLHLLAGAGFVSNWAQWNEAGYFDKAAEMKPLLHLWSLGIEEQFYIFWPPLLTLAFRRQHVWRWLAVCITASFALNLWLVQSHPSAAFYLPGGRAWELLAGAVVAFWIHTHAAAPARRRAGSPMLSVVGLALCAAGYLWLDASLAFPGIWAVAPVLGACLLILSGNDPAAPSRRWLSHPAMVWLGKMSYPLYLWHWPLLSFAAIIAGNSTPSASVRTGLVAASVLLSWATVVLIERPIRFGPSHWTKVAAPCLLMVVAATLGWAAYHRDGFTFRKGYGGDWDYSSAYRGAGQEDVIRSCAGIVADSPDHSDYCAHDKRGPAHYAIWGDSKAEALYWGFVRNSVPGRYWMLESRPSCAPLAGVSRRDSYTGDNAQRCNESNRAFLTALLNSKQIRTVAIVGSSFMIMVPRYYDASGHSASDGSMAVRGLDNAITALEAAGKRVVFVIDNPRLPDPHLCMDRKILKSDLVRAVLQVEPKSPNERCAIPHDVHLTKQRQYRALVERLQQKHPNLIVYDPTPLLCDERHNVCPMTMEGKFLYSYGDHLSDYGNGLVAPGVLSVLAKQD